jgi:hypothetical protein
LNFYEDALRRQTASAIKIKRSGASAARRRMTLGRVGLAAPEAAKRKTRYRQQQLKPSVLDRGSRRHVPEAAV